MNKHILSALALMSSQRIGIVGETPSLEEKTGVEQGESILVSDRCKIRFTLPMMFSRPDLGIRGQRVNVGTIGYVDHGKSTLQAAIQSVLGHREDPHYLRLELNKKPRHQYELSRKHLDSRMHRRGRRRL